MADKFSRSMIARASAAALLSAGFTAICGYSHSPLADVFGGLAAVAIVVPPLVAGVKRLPFAFLIAASSIIPICTAWLTMAVTWPQWACVVGVLASFAICLAACTTLLVRLNFSGAIAGAFVTLVTIAWLSWPIWLSPVLAEHQHLIDWLVPAHPLLAVNGELIDQGIWVERPLMYTWTALNQDVPLALPVTVGPCVLLHTLIALAATVTAMFSTLIAGRFSERSSALSSE